MISRLIDQILVVLCHLQKCNRFWDGSSNFLSYLLPDDILLFEPCIFASKDWLTVNIAGSVIFAINRRFLIGIFIWTSPQVVAEVWRVAKRRHYVVKSNKAPLYPDLLLDADEIAIVSNEFAECRNIEAPKQLT
jgi:hypothetical protein